MKNNSDGENTFPINFQPMPKRFIAWDKYRKDWVTKFLMPSTSNENSDDYTCPLTLGIDSKDEKNWLNNDQLIICQSTNLFDKDGKEIFEGHIVRVGGETGIVQMIRGEWHAVGDDDIPLSVWKPSGIEILGHILSNPELMEEK